MTRPYECRCRWRPSSGEDFCDIYGEPLRGCLWPRGKCHYDLGPWGAWRAFTNVICDVSGLLDEPEIFDAIVVEYSDGDVATNGDLLAFVYWSLFQTIGWSP